MPIKALWIELKIKGYATTGNDAPPSEIIIIRININQYQKCVSVNKIEVSTLSVLSVLTGNKETVGLCPKVTEWFYGGLCGVISWPSKVTP